MPDTTYFEEKGKETNTHPGTTKPHPADWTGAHWKGKTSVDGDILPGDFNRKVTVVRTDGIVQRRKLTEKQKKLAEYLLKGYTKRQAMLRAGYSPITVDKKDQTKGAVASFLDSLANKITGAGLTQQRIANKFNEWIDAKKVISARSGKKADEETDDFIEVPDYDTQIKAFDRWRTIMEPKEQLKPGQKKRQVTLTEWVNGDATEETTE